MAQSEPKRQHFIPRMLLKHFVDQNDHLWVGYNGKVFPTNTINAFVVRNLYTKSDFSHTRSGVAFDEFLGSITKNYDFDDQLTEFETKADPVVLRIVEKARLGQCPQLARGERDAWGRFVFALARRTPEAQQRISADINLDDAFYEAAKKVADGDGFPLPPQERLMADNRVLQLRDLVMTNSDARFAAGDDPHLQTETEKFIRETGLCVGIIKVPHRDFVIGSHGLAIVDAEFEGDPAAGSWVPAAHDVAVKITAFPNMEYLVCLDSDNDGDRVISAINNASAKSKMFAGRSENLISSLLPESQVDMPTPRVAR